MAFSSEASNMVKGDGNEAVDIFLYDRQNPEITRVSVGNRKRLLGSDCRDPRISGDGRFVFFTCNRGVDTSTRPILYRYDIEKGKLAGLTLPEAEEKQ